MDRTILPVTEGKDVAAGVGIAATADSSLSSNNLSITAGQSNASTMAMAAADLVPQVSILLATVLFTPRPWSIAIACIRAMATCRTSAEEDVPVADDHYP